MYQIKLYLFGNKSVKTWPHIYTSKQLAFEVAEQIARLGRAWTVLVLDTRNDNCVFKIKA
jgi:hypothetical protein